MTCISSYETGKTKCSGIHIEMEIEILNTTKLAAVNGDDGGVWTCVGV